MEGKKGDHSVRVISQRYISSQAPTLTIKYARQAKDGGERRRYVRRTSYQNYATQYCLPQKTCRTRAVGACLEIIWHIQNAVVVICCSHF